MEADGDGYTTEAMGGLYILAPTIQVSAAGCTRHMCSVNRTAIQVGASQAPLHMRTKASQLWQQVVWLCSRPMKLVAKA